MIFKVVFVALAIVSSLFADTAKVVKVINENLISVEHEGQTKKIRLGGIELFANANAANRTDALDANKRDELRQKALSYMNNLLSHEKQLKYGVLDTDAYGVQTVWVESQDFNYKLVRDGYAIVNAEDKALPSGFKMRMTMAMKYAQERKLGLWADHAHDMAALVDTSKHLCGWSESTKDKGWNKEEVLKSLQIRAGFTPQKTTLARLSRR